MIAYILGKDVCNSKTVNADFGKRGKLSRARRENSPRLLCFKLIRAAKMPPMKLKGPNILHICGNADLILDDMIATGTNCISIDSHTDGKLAVEKSRGKVSVAGNVDSILLLRKKPEDIKNETIRSINAGFDLIAPARAISPLTANQNIKAMVEATKQ